MVTHDSPRQPSRKPAGTTASAVRRWAHAAGPRSSASRSASRVTLEGASFSLHAGRQGRARRPQRRRQDHDAQGHRGRGACRGRRRARARTRSGYLPQNPRPRGSGVDDTGLSHVLSGRGLDDGDRSGSRSCGCASRRTRPSATSRSSPAPRSSSATRAATRAESEVRRIAAGLGLADDRLDLPIDALSGGERRRVELARILFAGSDLLLLDEPTNHLDIDAKEWLIGFLRQYRGALLVDQPRPRPARRVDHARAAPRTTASSSSTRARTRSTSPRRAADEERLAELATRQGAEIDRLSPPRRHACAARPRSAPRPRSRSTRASRKLVQTPGHRARSASSTCEVKFPDPPRRGQRRARGRRPHQGLRRAARLRPTSTFAVERGERLLVMGLNGAGKTSLMRILAGQTHADAGARSSSGTACRPGYYAQEHEGIAAGTRGARTTSAPPASPTQQLRTPARHVRALGRHRVPGRGHALAAARRRSSRSRSSSPGATTCCCSTSRRTTSTRRHATRSARALADWPGAMVLVSHDAEFVARSSRSGCC